jgi:hypothetical protein
MDESTFCAIIYTLISVCFWNKLLIITKIYFKMKKQLLLITLLIANFTFAQTTVNFESLTVPASGYFNGATEYAGSGESQIISYEEEMANFYVNYTAVYDNQGDFSYDYWNGFAYSNQTDLNTASYTNYSAYSPNGGGANGSTNYGFVYSYSGDTMTFDQVVNVQSIMITNSVWAYKFIDGSDGTGHDFQAGDYFKLTITAVTDDGGTLGDSGDDTLGNSVDFYLADFTNGNSTIIGDWTNVDLSSLGNVKGLKFSMTATDNYTPYYFAMDDLVYSTTLSVSQNSLVNSIKMYPNPAKNSFSLSNIKNANVEVFALNGKRILAKNNCFNNESFVVSGVETGVYFVRITKDNKVITKKLIIQ